MPNIYVEREDDGSYIASQKKRIIATGNTQSEAIERARQVRPEDPVLAERVRDTGVGKRDKWRRAY